nr:unnamed protein product [Callosobruchus analis]
MSNIIFPEGYESKLIEYNLIKIKLNSAEEVELQGDYIIIGLNKAHNFSASCHNIEVFLVSQLPQTASKNPEQRLQCLSEREARASGNVDITITSHLQGRNDDEDDEVFKVVARKRNTKNARLKPCIGSNESECALKAAQKFSAVFLSGFEASLQPTKIIEHLKDHQLDKHCV